MPKQLTPQEASKLVQRLRKILDEKSHLDEGELKRFFTTNKIEPTTPNLRTLINGIVYQGAEALLQPIGNIADNQIFANYGTFYVPTKDRPKQIIRYDGGSIAEITTILKNMDEGTKLLLQSENPPPIYIVFHDTTNNYHVLFTVTKVDKTLQIQLVDSFMPSKPEDEMYQTIELELQNHVTELLGMYRGCDIIQFSITLTGETTAQDATENIDGFYAVLNCLRTMEQPIFPGKGHVFHPISPIALTFATKLEEQFSPDGAITLTEGKTFDNLYPAIIRGIERHKADLTTAEGCIQLINFLSAIKVIEIKADQEILLSTIAEILAAGVKQIVTMSQSSDIPLLSAVYAAPSSPVAAPLAPSSAAPAGSSQPLAAIAASDAELELAKKILAIFVGQIKSGVLSYEVGENFDNLKRIVVPLAEELNSGGDTIDIVKKLVSRILLNGTMSILRKATRKNLITWLDQERELIVKAVEELSFPSTAKRVAESLHSAPAGSSQPPAGAPSAQPSSPRSSPKPVAESLKIQEIATYIRNLVTEKRAFTQNDLDKGMRGMGSLNDLALVEEVMPLLKAVLKVPDEHEEPFSMEHKNSKTFYIVENSTISQVVHVTSIDRATLIQAFDDLPQRVKDLLKTQNPPAIHFVLYEAGHYTLLTVAKRDDALEIQHIDSLRTAESGFGHANVLTNFLKEHAAEVLNMYQDCNQIRFTGRTTMEQPVDGPCGIHVAVNCSRVVNKKPFPGKIHEFPTISVASAASAYSSAAAVLSAVGSAASPALLTPQLIGLRIFAYILQNSVSASKINEEGFFTLHNLAFRMPEDGFPFAYLINETPNWQTTIDCCEKTLNTLNDFGFLTKTPTQNEAANIARYIQQIATYINALTTAGVLLRPHESQERVLEAVIAKIVPYCEPGLRSPNFDGLLRELRADQTIAPLLNAEANMNSAENIASLAKQIEAGLQVKQPSPATSSSAPPPDRSLQAKT